MAKQKNLNNVATEETTEVITEVITEETTEETTEVTTEVATNNQLPLVERTYKNPELTAAVHTIGNATIVGNMARWQIAKACYNIAQNNLWNKDFKSQKDFADSIGVANSTITSYKNAVAFTIKHPEMIEVNEIGDIVGGITVDKADILSKVEDYDGLSAYCVEHEHKEAYTIGDNKLKKVIADYKKTLIEDKSNTEDTEETTLNATISEEKTTKATVIDSNGNRVEYDNIPLSILNRAMDLMSEYVIARYDNEGNKIG